MSRTLEARTAKVEAALSMQGRSAQVHVLTQAADEPRAAFEARVAAFEASHGFQPGDDLIVVGIIDPPQRMAA